MPFACIHVPDFILQAALRVEPGLRSQPVGILDGTPPLVTVIAKNKKAGSLGLWIGMTKSQAEQIAGLQLRRRSIEHESAAHAALVDLALSFSPRIEETAADTITLDLEGLAQLFGGFENLVRRLARRAKKFGLSVHVATGSNPEAAQLAARGFAGVTILAAEEEPARLGQLPTAALNLSAEIQETLDRWGVRTCGALAALPVEQLSERLGQEGVRLQELARGASRRALVPALAATQFEEVMELDTPVRELEPLAFLLHRLLDQLCGRLSARALATNEIRLKMQLEPGEEEIFEIVSKPHLSVIPSPGETGMRNLHFGKGGTNADSSPAVSGVEGLSGAHSSRGAARHGGRIDRASSAPTKSDTAPAIYEHALRLPLPMRDSKALLRLWRLHLESHPPALPIVKITMAAEPAKIRVAQSGLFTPLSPDPEKLEITMARTAHFTGAANIGAPKLLDTHRPLSFRIGRFEPATDGTQYAEGAASSVPTDTEAGEVETCATRLSATALRVFRPAMPTKVEGRDAAPARVFFGGVWGEVIAASGPWRSSGDWWAEDPWNQDEWDLEIEFPVPAAKETNTFSFQVRDTHNAKDPHQAESVRSRGVYRIVRERASGNWFVRGVYD
jgi:nucleotidyltransferase/DNA polymerase involved in DNA repair